MKRKRSPMMAVRFTKKHVLGRSNFCNYTRQMSPGDVCDLPRWQAQDLEAKGIVKVEKDHQVPKDKEAYVRQRLETFDEATILRKLRALKVTAKPGTPKAELIELYVNAVRPKAEGKDEKNGRKEQKR